MKLLGFVSDFARVVVENMIRERNTGIERSLYDILDYNLFCDKSSDTLNRSDLFELQTLIYPSNQISHLT